MNLVEVIKGQLAGEVIAKLSAAVGVDQATLEKALSAIVPGMLATVSGLTSTSAGAEKVTKTLGSPDLGSWGDLTSVLTGGGAAKAEEKGGDLLSSLLGGGSLMAIVTALSKFVHIDGKVVKSLLAFVGPMVLKTIAAQFHDRALTPAALSSLMTEQKSNITAALPPGLSIPDLSSLAPSAPAAAGVVPGWLIPVLALGLIAGAGVVLPERRAGDARPGPRSRRRGCTG